MGILRRHAKRVKAINKIRRAGARDFKRAVKSGEIVNAPNDMVIIGKRKVV